VRFRTFAVRKALLGYAIRPRMFFYLVRIDRVHAHRVEPEDFGAERRRDF